MGARQKNIQKLTESGYFEDLSKIDRSDFPVLTPGDNYSRYMIKLQDILNQCLDDPGFRFEYEPFDARYGRGGYFTVTYKAICVFPPESGIKRVLQQGLMVFQINPEKDLPEQIAFINEQWSLYKEWVNDNRRAESQPRNGEWYIYDNEDRPTRFSCCKDKPLNDQEFLAEMKWLMSNGWYRVIVSKELLNEYGLKCKEPQS